MDQSDDAVHTDIINEINSICDRVQAEGAFDAAARNSYQRRYNIELLLKNNYHL